MPAPTRATSEQALDQWNQGLRASPVYLDFMRRQGLPTNGRVSLTPAQQTQLEHALAQSGIPIPSGMHIDQGGNLNQKNRLVRNVGIGAAATGAALTGFGLAGMGPLAGLGGAAAGTAGTGGALASMGAPAAIGGTAASIGAPAAIGGTLASIGVPAAIGGSTGASMSIGSILSSLLKNPETYSALAGVLGGSTRGQADERTGQNLFNQNRDRATADLYGTQQSAALQALLGRESGAMNRYQTQQGATSHALDAQSAEGLNRAQLGLQAPTTRARQSVMGSLMQNLQPTSVANMNPRLEGRVPHIAGGLSPSVLNADTRQQGGELTRASLLAQLTGSDVPAATDFSKGILTPPEETDFGKGLLPPPSLSGYQDAGGMERTTGTAALIASLLGALRRPQTGGAP